MLRPIRMVTLAKQPPHMHYPSIPPDCNAIQSRVIGGKLIQSKGNTYHLHRTPLSPTPLKMPFRVSASLHYRFARYHVTGIVSDFVTQGPTTNNVRISPPTLPEIMNTPTRVMIDLLPQSYHLKVLPSPLTTPTSITLSVVTQFELQVTRVTTLPITPTRVTFLAPTVLPVDTDTPH